MSGFIPKEKLTAYERWELASFDEPEPAPEPAPDPEPDPAEAPSDPIPEIALPTAEEIERIHNEAWQAGHDAGREAGYEAGYQAGQEAGYAEGMREATTHATRIAGLMDSLDAALAGIDQALAEQVLALALETASQVLRHSLRVRPELILPAVREALAALPPHVHGHPALYLHPDDATSVREALGEQLAHGGWRILEDPALTPGGCRIEAGASEVDASLESRWRRALEAIGVTPDWLERQA